MKKETFQGNATRVDDDDDDDDEKLKFQANLEFLDWYHQVY